MVLTYNKCKFLLITIRIQSRIRKRSLKLFDSMSNITSLQFYETK